MEKTVRYVCVSLNGENCPICLSQSEWRKLSDICYGSVWMGKTVRYLLWFSLNGENCQIYVMSQSEWRQLSDICYGSVWMEKTVRYVCLSLNGENCQMSLSQSEWRKLSDIFVSVWMETNLYSLPVTYSGIEEEGQVRWQGRPGEPWLSFAWL